MLAASCDGCVVDYPDSGAASAFVADATAGAGDVAADATAGAVAACAAVGRTLMPLSE